MAEPWNEDFAALGEATSRGLRSADATRALLSTQSNQESKMKLFKSRSFAVLAALAALVIAGPLAYAFVDRVFLSIDPDREAPEIADDVKTQLESAGVPATVTADKDGTGNLDIRIQTRDQRLGPNLEVDVPDVAGDRQVRIEVAREVEVRLELACALTDAQSQRLHEAVGDEPFMELLRTRDGRSDAELATAIADKLAGDGFQAIRVSVDGAVVTVRVDAPPV